MKPYEKHFLLNFAISLIYIIPSYIIGTRGNAFDDLIGIALCCIGIISHLLIAGVVFLIRYFVFKKKNPS